MQTLSANYPIFILTLLALFFFGLIYAYFIRQISRAGVQGQTAYAVAFGVGVTVLASIGLIGAVNVALLLACFAASGVPMILEYANRTHHEQKSDRQAVKNIAKDLLK